MIERVPQDHRFIPKEKMGAGVPYANTIVNEKIFIDPQSGAVSGQVAILVNGRHYSHLPDGLNTVLKDEDDVALFPPLAGG